MTGTLIRDCPLLEAKDTTQPAIPSATDTPLLTNNNNNNDNLIK